MIPILTILYLMIRRQWPASRAAGVAFVLAVLIAVTMYRTTLPQILVECGKGLWNAGVILGVIWTAIILYEIMNAANAFPAMKQGIRKLTGHERWMVMTRGLVCPRFLHGITGFGVAVAVGAPLLVGIGVQPFWAVIIVLLCHSWGGTFGTLALAWQALVSQAELDAAGAAAAGHFAALFIWIVNLTGVLMLCWFYGKKAGLKEGLPAALVLSAVHGLGEYLLVGNNSAIACFLPACLSFIAVFLLSRIPRYSRSWKLDSSPVMDRSAEDEEEEASELGFNSAFLPYYVLTGVTCFCLLIPPVKEVLEQFQIGFAFPEIVTGYGYITPGSPKFSPLSPLTYPGTFLGLTCLFSYLYFRKLNVIPKGTFSKVMKRAVKKTVPSSLAVIGFILTSKAMGCSGEIIVLAKGLASVFGRVYVVFAPLVGLLGSFMTSSNMSSNILFAKFQVVIAEIIGADTHLLLGGQTAGAASGNAICPGNLVLGSSTVGQGGQEGKILRIVLPIVFAEALSVGLLMMLITFFH